MIDCNYSLFSKSCHTVLMSWHVVVHVPFDINCPYVQNEPFRIILLTIYYSLLSCVSMLHVENPFLKNYHLHISSKPNCLSSLLPLVHMFHTFYPTTHHIQPYFLYTSIFLPTPLPPLLSHTRLYSIVSAIASHFSFLPTTIHFSLPPPTRVQSHICCRLSNISCHRNGTLLPRLANLFQQLAA